MTFSSFLTKCVSFNVINGLGITLKAFNVFDLKRSSVNSIESSKMKMK
jgi:hypothetical protein